MVYLEDWLIFRFRLLRTKSHTLFSSQTIAHSDPAIQLINRERSLLLCVLLEAFKSVVSMSSLDHPPYESKNSLILVDVSFSSGRLSVCHKYVLSLDHPFLSKHSTPYFEVLTGHAFWSFLMWLRHFRRLLRSFHNLMTLCLQMLTQPWFSTLHSTSHLSYGSDFNRFNYAFMLHNQHNLAVI